ncbi:MAG: sulfatase family protein [Planctomycetota bacterium]
MRKPNVVILFIDDLGYGDLGSFGCRDIPTPHMDSLAANGIKCTNSYVTNPPCSPSRCCIMTGMYIQRFGKSGMARGLAIPSDHPLQGAGPAGPRVHGSRQIRTEQEAVHLPEARRIRSVQDRSRWRLHGGICRAEQGQALLLVFLAKCHPFAQ